MEKTKKPSVRQIRKKKDTGIYMKNVLPTLVSFNTLSINVLLYKKVMFVN